MTTKNTGFQISHSYVILSIQSNFKNNRGIEGCKNTASHHFCIDGRQKKQYIGLFQVVLKRKQNQKDKPNKDLKLSLWNIFKINKTKAEF